MRCNDYVCNYFSETLLYLVMAVVYLNSAYSSTFLIGGGGGGGGGGGCCCGGGGGGGGGDGGCARCPRCLSFYLF